MMMMMMMMMMMTIIPPFTLWGSVKNGETRKAHRENIYSFALSLFPSRALLECSRPPPRPVRAVSATPNSLAPSLPPPIFHSLPPPTCSPRNQPTNY
jgi:hypothetical protein